MNSTPNSIKIICKNIALLLNSTLNKFPNILVNGKENCNKVYHNGTLTNDSIIPINLINLRYDPAKMDCLNSSACCI